MQGDYSKATVPISMEQSSPFEHSKLDIWGSLLRQTLSLRGSTRNGKKRKKKKLSRIEKKRDKKRVQTEYQSGTELGNLRKPFTIFKIMNNNKKNRNVKLKELSEPSLLEVQEN